LACHLAEAAYDTPAQFAEIRDELAGRGTNPEAYSIEYLRSREYSPVHGLALVGSPHVVVGICLLNALRFRVHLSRLNVGPPYVAYMCLSIQDKKTAGCWKSGSPLKKEQDDDCLIVLRVLQRSRASLGLRENWRRRPHGMPSV
jgi:hypothetical protein